MVKNQIIWVFCALALGSLYGCTKTQSTKIVNLSTISSTDTVKAGTPKGMHLYLDENGALNLNELLAEQGFDLENLNELLVDEIRIKVEIPENNFNPNSIESFNTSFGKQGNLNTVIESKELDYTERTYVIKVHESLSAVNKLDNVIDLNGGLKLRDNLKHDVVLTTNVLLRAKVNN